MNLLGKGRTLKHWLLFVLLMSGVLETRTVCAQEVRSLHAVFLEKDAVLVDNITGTWKTDVPGLVLSISPGGDNFYILSESEQGKSSEYEATLVPMGRDLILDLLPVFSEAHETDFAKGHQVTAHSFYLVRLLNDTLYLSGLSYRWFLECIKNDCLSLPFAWYNKMLLLTASTADVQEFLRLHINGLRFLALPLAVIAYTLNAQEPQLLSGPEIAPGVWGIVEEPSSPGPHPTVVILHGSFGWRPAYAQVAKSMADSGFVALAINYFTETGRDTVSGQASRMWPSWQAAVRSAVSYLQALPSVSNRGIGVVGFSRGAFLAVSMASSVPAIRAVVDFFGGGGTGASSLEQQVQNLPPLLILHGEADTVVPVRFAHRLYEAVVAQGGQVEMRLYPGAHHAFNATFTSTYSESAATDSFKRTIDFLRRRLAQ